MYKRRKKPLNPQASSTLMNSGLVVSSGPGSSTALSQASTATNSSDESKSASPLRGKDSISPDLSLMTTKGTDVVPPSFEKENMNTDVLRPSQYRSPSLRPSAKDVLDMLTSPSSSQGSPSPRKIPRLELPKRTNLNYMEEVLHKSGFLLGEGSEPNILRKDQSVFVRDVSKALKTGDLSRNVEEFMRCLKKHIEKKECLKTALSQTRTDSNTDISHGEMQESLIRLLLMVDYLQPPLVDVLLDKLAEFILPDFDSNQPDERIMWVRLIIRSMRYLNNVIDASKLTKSLFDVIHSSTDLMIQTEILSSIPDMTGDEHCADVAQELIDLMKEVPKLSSSVIIALSNIGLEGDVLYQVRMSLIKTLRKAPMDQIPAFVKFIVNGVDSIHMDEIINGLRSELVVCQVGDMASSQIATAANKSDVSSVLVLTFEGIRDAVLMSKKLASIWLKNIGRIKSNKTQKPIDIIMLLIIYASSDQTRKKGVEAVFKSKIKDGTFKEGLVDETVEALGDILKTYFSELLELLSLLLHASDGSVSSFASYFFNECFLKMESLYCRMIILELLESVRLDSKHITNVLELLYNLTSKFPGKVANYVTRIMLLLDILQEMRVLEVRKLMDIICTVAWGSHDDSSLDMSSLQDEIIMIVQKQLRCSDSKIFRNGVVCALMVIKHLTSKTEEETNETPLSEISEDSLILNSKSEKAFSFLELIIQGSRSSPEVHVFTYDQLAYVIMNCDNMDKIFMKRVSQVMQATLQNHYIIASSDFVSKHEGLDEKLQFCLDTDLEDPIILNLCDAVVEECKQNSGVGGQRIVALPALFRVIRSLELADLTEIDALLGCAVALPCPSVYAKFSKRDPYIQKIALDCLFYTCNWFRECVNSFVYMVKEGSPDKVVLRLRAIVYLQNLIARCLSQTGGLGYSPPACNIDPSSSGVIEKAKRINAPRRKTKKKNSKDDKDNDETVAEETVIDESEEEEEEEEPIATEFSQFRMNLRELDFDVCLVLTLPLQLSAEPPKDGTFTPEFGPSELLLMLEDLSAKLKYCIGKKTNFGFRKIQNVGFDNLSSTPLDIVIKNTAKLIGHLTGHLQKIVAYLHNMVTVHDSCYDAPGMFIPGSAEMKRCSALIFDVFDTFFSWSDLKNDVYIKFLLRALMKVAGKPIEKNQLLSVNYAVQQAVDYLKTVAKCVLDLTSAVNLTKLITTIASLQEDIEEEYVEINTATVTERYLRRKWYDFKGAEEKGPAVNQQLCKLLETYFTQGRLPVISSSLKSLSEETKELGNDSSLASFPQFQKSNLNLFIKSACKSLALVVKAETDDKSDSAKLKVWETTVTCLQDLVIVVKNEDNINNLRQFLKGCVPVMKLFLTSGMPVCSLLFKYETMTVSQTLRKLQVVTRYVQNVCNYSKVIKDRSLIQQLPTIRGVLEQIILSVKNMVLQNNCTDAFFMGSMKNKDHHGEVIPTQESMNDSVATSNDDGVEQTEISAINSVDDNSEAISDTC